MVRKLFGGSVLRSLLALGLSFFWAQYLSASMFPFITTGLDGVLLLVGATKLPMAWKNFLGNHFLFLLVDALEVRSIYLSIPQT